MTAVIFKFQKPDGTPVADAPFTVSLRKSSFDEQGDGGILLPGDVAGLTDTQGMCTLELAEGHGIYYLTMVPADASVDPEGCTVGLRYKFIVPVSATPVRVEDLIVTTPTFSRPWDEVALAKITQAVIDSRNSEIAAAASAVRAENAAVTIEGDADRAEAAAMVALASKDSATASASTAVGAAADALASKNAAATSQNAANNSAISASNDATLAGQHAAAALASQNAAASSATTATQQATAAGQAKTAAETAASTATTKAGESASSASAAAGSASTANTKAGEASASATAAKTSETNAKTSETNAATSASNASTAGAAAGTAAANAVVANKQDKHINLTAFAGLAGAVDALPYFTGAGALSLATLTAKARGLLARIDTAGMQAELALVPVTSFTDNTLNRLVTPGFNGLGRDLLGIDNTPDVAIAANRGAAFSYTNKGPVNSTNDVALVTLGVSNGYAFQLACDLNTNTLYSRSKLGPLAATPYKKVTYAGDYGIGGNTSPDYPNGSFNNASVSGFYRWSDTTTGSPVTGYGTTLRSAYEISSGNWTEIVQSMVQPRGWLRASINGSASAFAELHTTFNSQLDPSLGTGGLMSMTTVSGFTVFKYLNGQMIVQGPVPTTASIAANTQFTISVAIPVAFPAGNVSLVGTLYPSVGNDFAIRNTQAPGSTAYLFCANGASAQTFSGNIMLVGRWK